MTQGFDEYLDINYNENLDDLTKFLIHDAYKSGASSRQAEIDDSENTRAVLYRENMDLRESNIELQKRINLCVSYIEDNHLNEKDLVLLVYGFLKGESNE